MPYGIQQPAVSSQILLLEQGLGTKLFERQPFRLTREGEELFEFVRPFFENLGPVAERLRKQAAPSLRIGASEIVLRHHLPAVIQQLKQDHPELRLALRSGFQPELEEALTKREIDLAFIPLRGRLPARTRCLRLMRLPLVLLVPRKSKLKSAETLWTQRRPAGRLISLPPTESISLVFQRGLPMLGATWPPAIQASSMELITQYVASGDGVGVSIALPGVVNHPAVRVLPLAGFEPIEVVALWNGAPTPLVRMVLAAAQRYVASCVR